MAKKNDEESFAYLLAEMLKLVKRIKVLEDKVNG